MNAGDHLDLVIFQISDMTELFELPSDSQTAGRDNEVAEVSKSVDLSKLPADFDRTETLFAAWCAVLERYSGSSRFTLGQRAGDASWAVHEVLVTGTTSFADLVRSSGSLQLHSPNGLNVSELLRKIGVEPPPSRHPIFQVGFEVEGNGPNTVAKTSDGFDPCDVLLRCSATTSSVVLTLEYRTSRNTETWAAALLEHVATLINNGIDNPDCPIGQLGICTSTELATIDSWATAPTASFASSSLFEQFCTQALETPEVVAVECNGESITYHGLVELSREISTELRNRGATNGTLVAITNERSIGLIASLLAVFAHGGGNVPIDSSYPPARRELMLEDCGARLSLYSGEPNGPVTVTGPVLTAAGQNADDQRPAYVIYTSGSTGKPKGVDLTERALLNLLDWQRNRPGFAPGRRVLQFTSISFDVSFQEIFSTLLTGGTVVMIDELTRRNSDAMLRHIIEHNVERLFVPFVALRGLATSAARLNLFPTTLLEVYTAGEQLRVDDAVRLFFRNMPDCELENQYGPAEATVIATAYALGTYDASWVSLPPIGRPVTNTTVSVCNPFGELQPKGVVGELRIGGAGLARGYLGDEARTAERFVDTNGTRTYRTGDLVSWLPDGNLRYHGRNDNQVKFRGYRIEPGEISVVLSNHPDVEHAVATVRQVSGSAPRLIAFVHPRGVVDLRALREFASEHLPAHMVPSHYSLIDTFPLTGSGKIDLDSIATPTFDRSTLSKPFLQCVSTDESTLANIWSKLLGVDVIGRNDDYFELGGDSLLAVEMFAAIQAEFGADLPLGALASQPTVGGLASLLSDPSKSFDVLVQLKQGTATPLFCVHGGSGNVASFPKLARALPDNRPMYALQWDGLDGSTGRSTIESMAELYTRKIQAIQPHGPYLLAGQCVGGLVAREISSVLMSKGEVVDLLVMFDSPNLAGGAYRPPAKSEEVKKFVVKRFNALYVSFSRRAVHGMSGVMRAMTLALRGESLQNDHDRPDPFATSSRILVAATRAYRIKPLGVRTIYFGSGESDGNKLGLSGTWTDGFLGFAEFQSSTFTLTKTSGGHNDILYSAAAIESIREALSEFP